MSGETALHRVCIKNQVEKLIILLSLPGIDINVKGKISKSLFSPSASYNLLYKIVLYRIKKNHLTKFTKNIFKIVTSQTEIIHYVII